MNYSITQNGKKLAESKYTIDEKAKTFSTIENNLVLDFSGLDGWAFKTGWSCTFKTGSDCTFNTGSDCTFKTRSCCTFNTGSNCTFNTGSNCTFNTGLYCTFKTSWGCIFNTGNWCVVVRRDVYKVIELDGTKKIKLNGYREEGYTVIEDELEEEKMIELSNGKKVSERTILEALRQQFE